MDSEVISGKEGRVRGMKLGYCIHLAASTLCFPGTGNQCFLKYNCVFHRSYNHYYNDSIDITHIYVYAEKYNLVHSVLEEYTELD